MPAARPTPPPEALTVQCPAKVNWFLDIRGIRPDGYHSLVSVMQRVSLADTLEFERRETPDIELDDGGACGCTASENIVVHAARRLQEAYGCRLGAAIRIRKRVPVAAGLGGGSANAAATLQALARLWSLVAANGSLRAIARDLGADVPFFLGPAAARCEGVGDVVTPVHARAWHLVLWNPGAPLSTAAVYKTFDRIQRPSRSVEPFLDAYATGDVAALGRAIWNNLALASGECMPKLDAMQRLCIGHGAVAAWVTGSGPTVASLCRSKADAASLAEKIRQSAGPNHVVEPVTTLVS